MWVFLTKKPKGLQPPAVRIVYLPSIVGDWMVFQKGCNGKFRCSPPCIQLGEGIIHTVTNGPAVQNAPRRTDASNATDSTFWTIGTPFQLRIHVKCFASAHWHDLWCTADMEKCVCGTFWHSGLEAASKGDLRHRCPSSEWPNACPSRIQCIPLPTIFNRF